VKDKVDRSAFPLLLQELDDPDLVVRFMAEVMPKEGEIQLDKSFLSFCKRHGWPTFEMGLAAIIDEASPATIARNTALLETLCLQRDKNADRMSVCKELGEHAVNALQRLDNHSPADDWYEERIDRAGLLVSLVKSLISVDCTEPLDELFDHTLSQVKTYDLTDAHLAAIFALESWLNRKLGKANRIVSRWLDHCRTELEQRTEHAPTPPTDFRRVAKLSCSCADSRELSRFLADPDESVHRFKVSKDRRQHVHRTIDGHDCDLTHVTTRVGSPHAGLHQDDRVISASLQDLHARYRESEAPASRGGKVQTGGRLIRRCESKSNAQGAKANAPRVAGWRQEGRFRELDVPSFELCFCRSRLPEASGRPSRNGFRSDRFGLLGQTSLTSRQLALSTALLFFSCPRGWATAGHHSGHRSPTSL
jgi:hypothetical protein